MAPYTKCTSLAEFERVEAKFYDDDDNERMTHESLEAYLDDIMANMAPGTTEEEAEAALVAMAPMRVQAYMTELAGTTDRDRWATDRVDSLEEWTVECYVEDLGDPQANAPTFNAEEREALKAIIVRWLDRVGVWRCEAVAEYTLSAEDIREILGRSE